MGYFIKCALEDDMCSTWHKILNMPIKEGVCYRIMPLNLGRHVSVQPGECSPGSAMVKIFEGGPSFFRGV